MHGHYIGDPQVYRTKEDRAGRGRPRSDHAAARAASGLGDDEFEAFDDGGARDRRRGAVEFAQNGTDPQPEDALKNVYA